MEERDIAKNQLKINLAKILDAFQNVMHVIDEMQKNQQERDY